MSIVEKKYLLKSSIHTLLKKERLKKEKNSLFFTYIQLCKEIRYKKVNKKYFKVVRTGSEVRENILNKKISKREYNEAKNRKISNILKKRRYFLKINGEKYTIDIYDKELKNLILLEKSFKNIDKLNAFIPPKQLKEYIVKDVSHNDRYRNKNLALLGNPKKIDYELYSIFRDIEKNRVDDLKTILFKEMSVEDGIRIILYALYKKLDNNKEQLIENESIHSLKEFRENIKECKIILKEFKYLFKEESWKHLYQHIALIDRDIDIKNIDILKLDTPLLESIFSDSEIVKFLQYLDEKLEKKKLKIVKFLQTREYKIIFNQLKLLIKENSNINQNIYDNTSLYKLSHKLIKKRFNKFKYLTKKYNKCYEIDAYLKIYSSLLKLKVEITLFTHFYKQEKLDEILKDIKSTLMSIDSFIKLTEDSKEIENYIIDNTKTLQDQNRLIKKLHKRRDKIEKELNKKIEIGTKSIKKHKKFFRS